jgi:hypothetical protein
MPLFNGAGAFLVVERKTEMNRPVFADGAGMRQEADASANRRKFPAGRK